VKTDDTHQRLAGYRVKSFAREIGCCRSTVYNLAAAGKIKMVKVGGMTVITTSPAELLARATEENQRPAPADGAVLAAAAPLSAGQPKRGRPKGSPTGRVTAPGGRALPPIRPQRQRRSRPGRRNDRGP
jgi:hypothetical protein